MNIALEQAEEYDVAGQLTDRHGDAFIRGNNVLYICTPSALHAALTSAPGTAGAAATTAPATKSALKH